MSMLAWDEPHARLGLQLLCRVHGGFQIALPFVVLIRSRHEDAVAAVRLSFDGQAECIRHVWDGRWQPHKLHEVSESDDVERRRRPEREVVEEEEERVDLLRIVRRASLRVVEHVAGKEA